MTVTTEPRIDPEGAARRIAELIAEGQARHYRARDRVSTAPINTLLDVLGDRNPVYTDEAEAKQHGHDSVIAPATALQVWTMNRLGEEPSASPVDAAYDILRDCGFPSVVAVNSEQHYDRPIVPGDLISSTETVEELSELKQTGLGPGMFITTLFVFRDEEDEQVGTMRFRTLWYAAAQKKED